MNNLFTDNEVVKNLTSSVSKKGAKGSWPAKIDLIYKMYLIQKQNIILNNNTFYNSYVVINFNIIVNNSTFYNTNTFTNQSFNFSNLA